MPVKPPTASLVNKNKYLYTEVLAFAKKAHADENLEFVLAKDGNQALYTKYIAVDSPREVNIPASMRTPLDALAQKKQWSAMSAGIKTARKEIEKVTNENTLRLFSLDNHGQRVLALWRMGLDGPKAKQAYPYLQLYQKPRTPEDGWKAFLALAKLAGEAKARAALTELGQAPPAKAPTTVDQQVGKNLQLDAPAKKMQVDVAAGLKYYESAIRSVKKDGLPADDHEVNRMFESGRMRHDKVHQPWTKAILAKKDFAKVYKSLAADKQKLDTQWAAYRAAIAEAEKKRGGR